MSMDGPPVQTLSARFESMQRELQDLLRYVKRTRATLGEVAKELPDASVAIGAVEQATAKAAHNLLGMVEQAMEADERLIAGLERLEQGSEPMREAVAPLREEVSGQIALMGEMMMELSFQDLTGQSLTRIAKGLEVVEARIARILDPSLPAADVGPGEPKVGSMSGLRRLQESQGGEDRQNWVDELLGR